MAGEGVGRAVRTKTFDPWRRLTCGTICKRVVFFDVLMMFSPPKEKFLRYQRHGKRWLVISPWGDRKISRIWRKSHRVEDFSKIPQTPFQLLNRESIYLPICPSIQPSIHLVIIHPSSINQLSIYLSSVIYLLSTLCWIQMKVTSETFHANWLSVMENKEWAFWFPFTLGNTFLFHGNHFRKCTFKFRFQLTLFFHLLFSPLTLEFPDFFLFHFIVYIIYFLLKLLVSKLAYLNVDF